MLSLNSFCPWSSLLQLDNSKGIQAKNVPPHLLHLNSSETPAPFVQRWKSYQTKGLAVQWYQSRRKGFVCKTAYSTRTSTRASKLLSAQNYGLVTESKSEPGVPKAKWESRRSGIKTDFLTHYDLLLHLGLWMSEKPHVKKPAGGYTSSQLL